MDKHLPVVSAPVLRQHEYATPEESDEESTIRPQRSISNTAVRAARIQPTSKLESVDINQPPISAAPHQEATVDISRAAGRPQYTSKRNVSTVAQKKQVPWYLEFSKRPATSDVWHGPIPYEDLAVNLVLEQSAVSPFFWSIAKVLTSDIDRGTSKVCDV